MKEKYIAPDLEFESFEVSSSIAAGCTDIAGAKTVNDDGFLDDGGNYFIDGVGHKAHGIKPCSTRWEDGIYERYCYWSGSDTNRMFCS